MRLQAKHAQVRLAATLMRLNSLVTSMRASAQALILLLLLSSVAIAAPGQQVSTPALNAAQPVSGNTTPPRQADHHLTLDVVVQDKSGKPVAGLDQQAFVVLDNKKPQAIRSFRAVSGPATADPLSIILLVDEVNTGFSSVAYERDAVKKFLRANGGKLPHPVSLIFFSDTGTEALNAASEDGNALAASLDQHDTSLRTVRRSAGFYGAVDRFQLSIQTMQSIAAREEAAPGRKLLLWISPGWPYLSGAHVDLTSKEEQGIFNSVVALNTSLRRARITLYSIDPLGTNDTGGFRTTFWEEFKKGAATPNDVQAGNLALQVLATETGGRVLYANNDVASLIAAAASEANMYYELTIDMPPAEHANEYHALDIRMEQPGLTARTRTGYYNQP